MERREITDNRESKVRLVLFCIATVSLFLIWGLRVYADNSFIIRQGEEKEITLNPAPEITPSNPTFVVYLDSITDETTSKIRVQTTEFEPVIIDGMHLNRINKIKVTVDSDTPTGSYRIKWAGLSICDINVIESEQPTTTTVKEKVQRVEKTPEEIYREELALRFPHGYAFVKAGDKDLIQTTSKDGLICNLYYAGTEIGNFSIKAADGTLKKLHVYDTIIKEDGRVYLQVWVNTNDGQTVTLDLTEEDRAAMKEYGITGVYVNKTAMDL